VFIAFGPDKTLLSNPMFVSLGIVVHTGFFPRLEKPPKWHRSPTE